MRTKAASALTLPLVVLAVLSVVGGYAAIYATSFDGVWSLIPEARTAQHHDHL